MDLDQDPQNFHSIDLCINYKGKFSNIPSIIHYWYLENTWLIVQCDASNQYCWLLAHLPWMSVSIVLGQQLLWCKNTENTDIIFTASMTDQLKCFVYLWYEIWSVNLQNAQRKFYFIEIDIFLSQISSSGDNSSKKYFAILHRFVLLGKFY